MRMICEVVTQPLIEPITLEEAKLHLRVDEDYEDDLITQMIQSAREYVEAYTGRALITQTRKLFLDNLEYIMDIPYPKLQSVTSVKYIDEDYQEQTLSTSLYKILNTEFYSQIIRKNDSDYPDVFREPIAVTIEYICGYGDTADSVPAGIKQAMLLLIGSFYQNRETIYYASIGTVADLPVSIAVQTILDKYKLPRI